MACRWETAYTLFEPPPILSCAIEITAVELKKLSHVCELSELPFFSFGHWKIRPDSRFLHLLNSPTYPSRVNLLSPSHLRGLSSKTQG